MILESMKLRNFRQFYGETPTLHFSRGDRNVTVIHGANGSGKTALLNAFTWALYGEFSRGFQLPDELVNKRAIREAEVGSTIDASIELTFSYAQRRYTLTREIAVERIATAKGWKSSGTPSLRLHCRDVDGVTKKIDDVTDTIGRILPADLHWYFFFDGERIERLVQVEKDKDDRRDLAAASKKLLGVEVLQRAERHLGDAKKILESELKRVGDAETVQLLEEKEEYETRVEDALKRRDELQRNIDGHSERKKLLKSRLREKQEVKEIQLKRDRLEQEEATFRDALRRARQEIRQAIRDDGFVVLLNRVASNFEKLLDELRKRGELPAGIKRQFVEDLLKAGECICGCSLEGDGEARRLVQEWMSRAGLADVEDKAIRMSGEIATLPDRITSFWKRVDALQNDIGVHTSKLAKIEDELAKIREQLRDDSEEEVSGLERQLEDTEAAMDRDNRDMGLQTGMISQYEAEIERLDRDIARHQALESRQRVAQQRVDAASESIHRIREVRYLFEKELRLKLQDRIQSLFRKISITPYTPQVEEDFSLTLHESAGGAPLPVAASTGESQVLSISFIGSLIELTKEFHARKERLPGPDDVLFPIVMDSPFGSLDQHHREQVATSAPDLADQVVTMVTKSQWQGAVEDSLTHRVGRHYVLTYFSPREDVDPDSIAVDGSNYEILKRSPNEFEYTEIQEVSHG